MKSAARVLRILEFFDRRRAAANVQAVALALGYPASSTGALLRSLVATGYLHYDRVARTFAPTLRVTLLGAEWVAPRLMGGGGPLPQLMGVLARRTGGCTALVARNGDLAEYIHLAGNPENGPLPASHPLTDPGVGQVLLSALPEKEVRGLLHRQNAGAIDAGRPALRATEQLEQLARLRRAGHSEALLDGQGMVAAALPMQASGGPHAIAVIVPRDQFLLRRAELAVMLKEEMLRQLGPALPPLRWPATPESFRARQSAPPQHLAT